MNAGVGFTTLLRIVAPVLKNYGFARQGQYFRLHHEENWGVVNFQKSVSSTRDLVVFTVNVGVASQLLREFFRSWRAGEAPVVDDCQWHQRLGFLLSDRQDVWWQIDRDTDIEQMGEVFRGHLTDVAIPAILSRLRDEDQLNRWLTAWEAELLDDGRLLQLAVMLAEYGPVHLYHAVAAAVRRKSIGKHDARRVSDQLERLDALRRSG